MSDDPITKSLRKAVQAKLSKNRIYVSDPDDVPDQYSVQEGSRGGYYYETDSGGGDGNGDGDDDGGGSDRLGDDAPQEEIDDAVETFQDSVDSDDMTQMRDDAMDMSYDMIEERPQQGADEINEQLEMEVEDMVWDEVDDLQQSGDLPELDGYAYDEFAEEGVQEVTDQIMDVAEVTDEDIAIQTEGIQEEPSYEPGGF